MSQPLVSIKIPAYNCAPSIGETIDTCLAQSRSNIEIIVVNDGSTDDTCAVLERYGSLIRVVAKPNGGLARARNVGQQVAFGEYVAWLDADDIAHPDRIAVQAAVLDREPTAALVCSDFSAFVTGLADIETSHIGTYYSSFAEREGAPGSSPNRVGCTSPAPGHPLVTSIGLANSSSI